MHYWHLSWLICSFCSVFSGKWQVVAENNTNNNKTATAVSTALFFVAVFPFFIWIFNGCSFDAIYQINIFDKNGTKKNGQISKTELNFHTHRHSALHTTIAHITITIKIHHKTTIKRKSEGNDRTNKRTNERDGRGNWGSVKEKAKRAGNIRQPSSQPTNKSLKRYIHTHKNNQTNKQTRRNGFRTIHSTPTWHIRYKRL